MDLAKLMQQHLDDHMPAGITVDPNLSEDDNVRAVQQQLAEVGDCTEGLARKLVREALDRRAS